MSRAFLALGGNLGDPRPMLERAVRRIHAEPRVAVCQVSSFYETAPIGGPPGQNRYLNAAVRIETTLSPESLLDFLLEIEQQAGRTRGERNAPRTLDLDILLFDDLVRESPDPILPHPRMGERRFVLEPLAEIAPNVIHPVLGKSVAELLAALPPDPDPPRRLEPAAAVRAHDLAGLRAVVTGSSSGIGRAIALELARGGASVIVHGRTDSQPLAETLAMLRLHEATAAAISCDLARRDDLEGFAERTWKQWGGIDVWINNAGVDLLTGEAADWSFDRKWTSLFAVDVTAALTLSRDIGSRMKASRGGVILNVGWDQSETGMEGDSGQLFGTAKAAIAAFTRSLAVDLAPRVRVNAVAPGWIKTAWGESAPPYWQDRVLAETPLRRWGLPEDVAAAAAWLVSPAAGFITGQVVRINGGAIR